MKLARGAITALLLSGFIGSCSDDEDEEPPADMCEFTADQIAKQTTAEALLAELEAADYEDNFFPLLEPTSDIRDQFVPSAHGVRVAVWVNQTASTAISLWAADGYGPGLEMPNGSILVKNNYDATDTLKARTVMKKDTSLDGTVYKNQWFLTKALPDFTIEQNCEIDPPHILMAGNLAGCTGCHAGATNAGVFCEEDDAACQGSEDAIIPYDMIVTAYCIDPANAADCTFPPED